MSGCTPSQFKKYIIFALLLYDMLMLEMTHELLWKTNEEEFE